MSSNCIDLFRPRITIMNDLPNSLACVRLVRIELPASTTRFADTESVSVRNTVTTGDEAPVRFQKLPRKSTSSLTLKSSTATKCVGELPRPTVLGLIQPWLPTRSRHSLLKERGFAFISAKDYDCVGLWPAIFLQAGNPAPRGGEECDT